ncbi:Mic1 domain-containing protein [Entamoeba marina]
MKSQLNNNSNVIWKKEDIFQTRHCIERILLKIGSQQHEQTITITSLINFIEEFQLSNEFAIDIYTKIITTATTIVLQIPNDIYTTLLFHLIQTKHYHILTQLLQYHIIPDTKEIAMQLINSEKENKNLYYIGLDILKRKKNYSLLVEVYLSRGDVLMALQIASQHKIDVLPQKTSSFFRPYTQPFIRVTSVANIP